MFPAHLQHYSLYYLHHAVGAIFSYIYQQIRRLTDRRRNGQIDCVHGCCLYIVNISSIDPDTSVLWTEVGVVPVVLLHQQLTRESFKQNTSTIKTVPLLYCKLSTFALHTYCLASRVLRCEANNSCQGIIIDRNPRLCGSRRTGCLFIQRGTLARVQTTCTLTQNAQRCYGLVRTACPSHKLLCDACEVIEYLSCPRVYTFAANGKRHRLRDIGDVVNNL